MNTMSLPLPAPARADKPETTRDSAPGHEAQGADKQGDTRFDQALRQARDDAPQAERAGDQPQGTPSPTVEAATTTPAALAIDPTMSSLWLAAALPQAMAAAEQDIDGIQAPSSADGKAHGTGVPPLSDLVEGGAANPLPLPLGLAMSTNALPRPSTPCHASTSVVPQAQPQDTLEAHGLAIGQIATPPGSITSASNATQPGMNTPAAITEQRPAASSISLQAQPAWAAVMVDPLQAPSTNASGTTLNLPATAPTQWREPLLNALGERVQWQLQRGQEQAVIRLEPPNLGRVEIHIRHEAGGLQVHLNATHRDVVQQLQGVSDQLRSELSLRHAGDVAVAVADQGRDADARQRGRGQGGDQAQDPGRALSEGESTSQQRSAFTLAGSTLEKA